MQMSQQEKYIFKRWGEFQTVLLSPQHSINIPTLQCCGGTITMLRQEQSCSTSSNQVQAEAFWLPLPVRYFQTSGWCFRYEATRNWPVPAWHSPDSSGFDCLCFLGRGWQVMEGGLLSLAEVCTAQDGALSTAATSPPQATPPCRAADPPVWFYPLQSSPLPWLPNVYA